MNVLGFDIGATKTAWALSNATGKQLETGRYPTPTDRQQFVGALDKLVAKHPANAVGIAMAGTISSDHRDLVVCPNVPELSHVQLVTELREHGAPLTTLENDARCALIGEVWKGGASEFSSAVMLTLGTGIGGAVMQKGRILPHPQDIDREIGRLVVDPTDIFPTTAGHGTVEALLGGRNLEARLGISMADEVKKMRAGDITAQATWEIIQEYFQSAIRTVYAEYSCRTIIIGGRGVDDLDYYLGNWQPPCPVVPAKLGEQAGLYGAIRIGLDIYDEENKEWDEK